MVQTKLNLLEYKKIINFAARVVTGARRTDRISPTLQALGWERVERLVEMKDVFKVHKILTQDLGPSAIRSQFAKRSDVSCRSTRSTEAGRLELPLCRLTGTQRAFRYRAAAAWNRLAPGAPGVQSEQHVSR